MDRNKVEIDLLQKNPNKLLVEYQQLIRIVVRVQIRSGLISRNQQQDLIQEINRKLIERIPKIQKQYNGTCLLKTYFSVIIRNMCLEELRKPGLVCEPEPAPYYTEKQMADTIDPLLVEQEYERLQRIVQTFGVRIPRLNLVLKYLSNVPISQVDLDLFSHQLSKPGCRKICNQLNAALEGQRKRKLMKLSETLLKLEGKSIPHDSLRKWFAAKQEECIRLMNGTPPSCSYTEESLQLLIEKNNLIKKVE